MEAKKRAVRHQTSEWIRITLRVNPKNKEYINSLCGELKISQNLLINKIIDCYRKIDVSIGRDLVVDSLKRDSEKYDITKPEIHQRIEELKEKIL